MAGDTMAAQARTANRKQRVGTVVSDHGDQTIVVSIGRASRHPLYRKVIRRTKRYHVHDPENAATLGDTVRIEECRPISRTKHWQLVDVLTERAVAEVAPESLDAELVSEVQRSAARAQAEQAEAAGTTDDPGEAAALTEPAAAEAAEDDAAAPAEQAALDESAAAPAAEPGAAAEGEQAEEERDEPA